MPESSNNQPVPSIPSKSAIPNRQGWPLPASKIFPKYPGVLGASQPTSFDTGARNREENDNKRAARSVFLHLLLLLSMSDILLPRDEFRAIFQLIEEVTNNTGYQREGLRTT
jgi:hypothetical protein